MPAEKFQQVLWKQKFEIQNCPNIDSPRPFGCASTKAKRSRTPYYYIHFFGFSDSTQLAFLNPSNQFGSFVNTAENQADAGTLGLTKEQIITHNWWSGPQFLRTSKHQWTSRFFKITTSNEPTFEELGNEEAANINTVSERSE
ncbi:unnamed protein product [Haemonchus placei]|uniref:Uncharacterized protein n=1 Tax=Haemonchus placei TaxID=6290 RepID=A0A0N4W710_HAEPC|nr:unnamed protein product [Haemonchus placei]